MFQAPKKVQQRFTKTITKFQKVLENAKIRDLNESDTVVIITDILSDVFGYDKYSEVTSELAIRGTFCDLAINLDGKIQFIIEVKAIGKELKGMHLKQAIDYGANKGIPWIILTNGLSWQLHKIKFEKPISHSLVYEFDFISLNPRDKATCGELYLLTKESLSKKARDFFFEKIQTVNRYTLGHVIVSEPVIKVVTREMKKISGGVRISIDEVLKIIQDEVLKRDILDSEESDEAKKRIRKYERSLIRKKASNIKTNNTQKTSEYKKLGTNNPMNDIGSSN